MVFSHFLSNILCIYIYIYKDNNIRACGGVKRVLYKSDNSCIYFVNPFLSHKPLIKFSPLYIFCFSSVQVCQFLILFPLWNVNFNTVILARRFGIF